MLLRVRHVLRNSEVIVKDLSKLMKVEEVRVKVALALAISDPSTLLLICKGKILEDGQKLLDYRMEDGLTIFVHERRGAINDGTKNDAFQEPPNGESKAESDALNELQPGESEYFNIGDLVDVQDTDGTWHEAKIEQIYTNTSDNSDIGRAEENMEKDGLIYHCRYERFPEQVDPVFLHRIRPRARDKLDVSGVGIEKVLNIDNYRVSRYLVNYNLEAPGELGEWYEAEIDCSLIKVKTRTRHIMATIYAGTGADSRGIPNCKVTKIDEIYIFPKRCPKTASKNKEAKSSPDASIPPRTVLDCRHCFDNPREKPSCRYCLCVICHKEDDRSKLLVCEECAEMYHTYCLSPPLPAVPEDDWYCPECKIDDSEVVKPGEVEKLLTRKLLKMPSAKTNRRWGGKQSCDGVSRKCGIVPINHFGPIPGVDVGTCWRYRKQAAEAGVHRPLVCGIHGKATVGAFSIVVAGGYEDNQDEGDKIIYTGSGGRDLSGNKRVAKQSKAQELERTNAALARNSFSTSAQLKKKNDAGDRWREGKPVRVVRSYKSKSSYGPTEGFRYDGIYKVTKYWQAKGKRGYPVWRFELRRDDPTPAPWTKKGLAIIKEKGLDKVIEVDEAFENNSNSDDGSLADNCSELSADEPKAKRPKAIAYEVPADQMTLIKSDTRNPSQWQECLTEAAKGAAAFYKKLAEVFTCAICQEVVHCPATLNCGHSLCLACVSRAKASGCGDCPTCRTPMTGENAQHANVHLTKALESLMPGYAKARKDGKRRT